jgi:hypothetical protein
MDYGRGRKTHRPQGFPLFLALPDAVRFKLGGARLGCRGFQTLQTRPVGSQPPGEFTMEPLKTVGSVPISEVIYVFRDNTGRGACEC